MILALVILWAISFACIPHLLLLNKRPTATLAWLWALLLFPGIGAILYLAVGTERVRRRRKRRKRSFRKRRGLSDSEPKAANGPLHELPAASPGRQLIETASRIVNLPTDAVGEFRLLRNGKAFYDALRQRINEAEMSIHVESFICRNQHLLT